jgi:hypothetical protein
MVHWHADVDRLLTGQVHVDESGSDMCHHYKGDMWHICMTNVVGLYDMWHGDDVAGTVGC